MSKQQQQQQREQSQTIETCEAVLADLENARVRIVERSASLDELRRRDAYAAHALSDAEAKRRLDAANDEAGKARLVVPAQ